MSDVLRHGWIDRLRSGDWLCAATIRPRARVLLIINLILVAWAVTAVHATRPSAQHVSSDFVSFYAAGTLAFAGRPQDAYDPVAHQRAEEDVAGPGRLYQFFFYPPPYLIVCAILATLPYALAFVLFEAATLGLFLAVMRALCRSAGSGSWLLPVLAFTPLFWTIGLGQNAFLTASLLAGATLLIDERPVLAGLLFGALCYKPHFGLLIPVALIAGGRWRCMAGAAAMVAALALASWLLYGTDTWMLYWQRFVGSGETYGSGRIAFAGMVSPFGAARLAGVPVGPALAIQGAATAGAACAVAWIWRCSPSQAIRSAALLAGTMVALPVVLLYDQMVTLVAIAWMGLEVRRTGALPWEKLVLVAAYLLPLLAFPFGMMLAMPLAPLPASMLLGLCVMRTWGRASR